MNRRRTQHDPFDPTTPIGADEGEVRQPVDEATDARDQRLGELLDAATRPPAELKLDWSRLRSGLAAAQPLRATEPADRRVVSEPARPRARRIILWLSGALSAAAAVVLATVLLLHGGDGTTTSTTGPQAKTDSGDVNILAAAAPSETVSFGVSESDADSLLDRSAGNDTGIVVVFPRQASLSEATSAGPAVLVVSSQTGLAGTAREDRRSDFDDFGIMSF